MYSGSFRHDQKPTLAVASCWAFNGAVYKLEDFIEDMEGRVLLLALLRPDLFVVFVLFLSFYVSRD